MAEKSEVLKEVVKYKGFFIYSDFYNYCYNWLKEEGYKVAEKEYIEKLSGGGKEVKIEWEAAKKISDYYKNCIVLKWHITTMNDAEAEENGKKIKGNKGDVKLTFEVHLERDYEDNWDKKPFWKMMRAIYDKYIMRTTQDEYEDRLEAKAISYIEDVKAFLNLGGKR